MALKAEFDPTEESDLLFFFPASARPVVFPRFFRRPRGETRSIRPTGK